MRSLQLAIALIALVASGCTGLATHRSARPVGDGNLEVGFSAAYPTWTGVIATAGAIGGAEGYLRYGINNRIDVTFNAGPTSVGGKFDFALVAKDKVNIATGLGLGFVNTSFGLAGTIADSLDSLEEIFPDGTPKGTVAGAGPDWNFLASFGSEQNEFTVGARVIYFGGAVGVVSTQGSGAGANTTGGGLFGGPVFSFTHRGDRLIVTPELDLFFGRYQVQAYTTQAVPVLSGFIVPSVTFALAK